MNIKTINTFFLILGNSKKYFFRQVVSNLFYSIFELINILSLSAMALLFTDFQRFEVYLKKNLVAVSQFYDLDNRTVSFYVLVLLLIFIFTTIFKLFLKWLIIFYNLKIEKEINDRIFNDFLKSNYLSILKIDSYKMFNILNYQVSRFSNSLVGSVSTIINSLAFLILILFVIFFHSNEIKILSFVFILLIVTLLIYLAIKKKIRKLDKNFTVFNLQRQSLLNETVFNIKYLKISKIYKPLLLKFKRISNILVKSIAIRQLSMHIAKPVIEIFFLLLLTIYFLSNYNNIQLNLLKFIPEISFYIISFYRIVPAVQQIYQSVISIKGSETAFRDISEIKINHFKENISKNKTEKISLKKKIEIRDLKFSYNKSKIVLNNLNLTIPTNQITCIYGASGSGKSTLIDIIIGLINPIYGKVLVDGQKLTNNNLDSWQNKIGYIGQSFYLLNEGVLRNILFREKNQNFKIAKKIFKIFFSKFEYKDLISKKTIGENGKFISFGQKQRLLLARLFYQNKELFILDEPTSSLDKKNSEIFKRTICKLKKTKTIIIITHDKAIKSYSDKVINLESL
tara:strand:- start:9457 stop:11160 length:1704 start_codon:yes stop_codon:yes gene_type:complete